MTDGGEARVYDPLDYQNVTRGIVRELMERPVHDLPLDHTFVGPGVYLLYYDGDFAPYAGARSPYYTQPIYVGKAEPVRRRSRSRDVLLVPGRELHSRIAEHVLSIQAAENLHLEHFHCRYMAVVPLWTRSVEDMLINEYWPVWNKCISGFGLHDPGGNRSPKVSWWDALHPGRPAALGWTARIQYVRTAEESLEKLRRFLVMPEVVAAETEAEDPEEIGADEGEDAS